MARRRRGGRPAISGDEPSLEGLELEAWGDQVIHVVGRTEAGFPYGPTLTEVRRASERSAGGAGWARAKRLLRELLEHDGLPVRDVGWVKKIGDGLSREVFGVEVELADGRLEAYAVALARRDADAELDDRTRRELRLVPRRRPRWFTATCSGRTSSSPSTVHTT